MTPAEEALSKARALHASGKIEDALGQYGEAVRLDPRDADALCDFGMALSHAGRFAEAAERLRGALQLRPEFTDARFNLGTALAALGRHDEALECFRAVLARVPHSADTYSNVGAVLQEQGELDQAAAAYEKALAIEPHHAEALSNLGALLEEGDRRHEAKALYQRALQADPSSARAAYNLGLAHLRDFEFEQGWRYYEARFHTMPPVTPRRAFAVPELSPADFGRGRSMAVWREQGVGDQVLYSTLLPELQARGEDFVVEVDARLVAAYRRAHLDWKVVAPEGSAAAFAGCERHVAMGSLPGLLRPGKESFASQPHALLRADAQRAAHFRVRLAREGTRVVGVSWRSFQPGIRGYARRQKSAPLEAFLPLSRRAHVQMLDLQYGDTAAERAAFAAAGGVLQRLEDLDLFNDLDGVLAAIDACDLVITTSNITAHLAGALGKPTWLVYPGGNPHAFCWASDDGRCLWYPALRIATGRELDTWPKVISRVEELAL